MFLNKGSSSPSPSSMSYFYVVEVNIDVVLVVVAIECNGCDKEIRLPKKIKHSHANIELNNV